MLDSEHNYFAALALLFVSLLGLVLLTFRLPSVVFEVLLILIFLLVSLIVLFGSYFDLSWTWKLGSLYFLVYLINVAYLYFRLGSSLLLNSMAVAAALGFLLSTIGTKSVRKEVEKSRVQVVDYQAKKSPVKKTHSPGKFIASKDGSVYHAPKCDWAKRIKGRNRVWLKDKTEARQSGYKQHSCLKK